MASTNTCVDVYLNHAVNEFGSLSASMQDMWCIGKIMYEITKKNSTAEVKRRAEHGLELKGNGVVNLVSQIKK